MSQLNVNNITKYTGGEVVVNDASEDVDFRVESNGNANMLFVDGGNNTVGIGTASPTGILHVDGHTSSVKSVFEGNGNGDEVPVQLLVKANDGSTSTQGLYGSAGSTSVDNTIILGASSTSGVKVDSYGHVTKPLQPAFLASATSVAGDQTITNATNTIVTLGAIIFDVNSDCSAAGLFTAPVTGKYQFSCNVGVDAGSGSLTRFSSLNGHITCSNRQAKCAGSGTIYSDDNDALFAKGSVLMDMDANDTCTLNVYVSRYGASGSTTIRQSASSANINTWLSGYLAC